LVYEGETIEVVPSSPSQASLNSLASQVIKGERFGADVAHTTQSRPHYGFGLSHFLGQNI
jgi:hypothetical protein